MATPNRLGVRSRVALALLGLGAGLLVIVSGPSSADVTTAQGSAYGYQLKVSLFGSPVNTRGFDQVACSAPNTPPGCAPTPAASSSPSVVLPPAGGNATQTDADGTSGAVPPASFFTSGQLDVSTQGTTGPTGSVTSSATLADAGIGGSEAFTATTLASTCTASETGVTGSTTVTDGVLFTDNGDTDPAGTGGVHDPVLVDVPVNPAPNTSFTGHIHVNGAQDDFRYVFNEQITNPDGSITVNAAHEFLLGPTAVGDLIIGQVVCGVTAVGPSTTSSTLVPGSTTTSSTLVPGSTTTTRPSGTTTTSTGVPSSTTTSTSPPGVIVTGGGSVSGGGNPLARTGNETARMTGLAVLALILGFCLVRAARFRRYSFPWNHHSRW